MQLHDVVDRGLVLDLAAGDVVPLRVQIVRTLVAKALKNNTRFVLLKSFRKVRV